MILYNDFGPFKWKKPTVACTSIYNPGPGFTHVVQVAFFVRTKTINLNYHKKDLKNTL